MRRLSGRVMVIAGSDSGGGAGIQADIKTVTCLGGYAMTAVTALTAQNTLGVPGIHAPPVDFVCQQVEAVLADLGADAIKTGMLHSAELVTALCSVLDRAAPGTPMVVDPVMTAKGGCRLVTGDVIPAIRDLLLPRATVVTPNAPEAGELTGLPVRTPGDLARAGRKLLETGARAAFVKGGHLAGDEVHDCLVDGDGTVLFFRSRREHTRHTHGTGCTLASAIATGLAQGLSLREAAGRARDYVLAAIRSAPGLGGGHGPLNHIHGETGGTGRPAMLGLSGFSGSGKTTLLVRLIPLLVQRGLRVATIKHAHHRFDVDHPGKDSHRHRMAGALEVMVTSSRRFAHIRELAPGDEPELVQLLSGFSPGTDLVLAEGFKRERHPRIEVHRPRLGHPPLWPDDPGIIAVATDEPESLVAPVPVLDLDRPEDVAGLVASHHAGGKLFPFGWH